MIAVALWIMVFFVLGRVRVCVGRVALICLKQMHQNSNFIMTIKSYLLKVNVKVLKFLPSTPLSFALIDVALNSC